MNHQVSSLKNRIEIFVECLGFSLIVWDLKIQC